MTTAIRLELFFLEVATLGMKYLTVFWLVIAFELTIPFTALIIIIRRICHEFSMMTIKTAL